MSYLLAWCENMTCCFGCSF